MVGDEAALQTAKRFGARENPIAANRPQLTIVYTTAVTELKTVYLPLIQTE
jgi:hypothetical protein